jgi:hypothetical protein
MHGLGLCVQPHERLGITKVTVSRSWHENVSAPSLSQALDDVAAEEAGSPVTTARCLSHSIVNLVCRLDNTATRC